MLNIPVGGCRQVIVIASRQPDDYTRRIKGWRTLQLKIAGRLEAYVGLKSRCAVAKPSRPTAKLILDFRP